MNCASKNRINPSFQQQKLKKFFFFRVGHYMLQTALYHQFFRMAKRYVNRKSPAEKTTYHDFLPQMFAQTSSMVLTDLILYPFETIVHRMYIQGTRTLIDNMDTGLSAVSMTVKYSGYFDCVRQVLETEGFWALYAVHFSGFLLRNVAKNKEKSMKFTNFSLSEAQQEL